MSLPPRVARLRRALASLPEPSTAQIIELLSDGDPLRIEPTTESEWIDAGVLAPPRLIASRAQDRIARRILTDKWAARPNQYVGEQIAATTDAMRREDPRAWRGEYADWLDFETTVGICCGVEDRSVPDFVTLLHQRDLADRQAFLALLAAQNVFVPLPKKWQGKRPDAARSAIEVLGEVLRELRRREG